MEREKILKLTENILKENKQNRELDMIKTIKKYGLKVGQGLLKNGVGAVLYSEYKEDKEKEINKSILVHPNQEFNEKIFLLAYLLGKFLIEKKDKVYACRINDIIEIYQDNDYSYFAKNLLMPNEEVINFVKVSKTIIETTTEKLDKYQVAKLISNKYKVPEIIALQRLEEIAEIQNLLEPEKTNKGLRIR